MELFVRPWPARWSRQALICRGRTRTSCSGSSRGFRRRQGTAPGHAGNCCGCRGRGSGPARRHRLLRVVAATPAFPAKCSPRWRRPSCGGDGNKCAGIGHARRLRIGSEAIRLLPPGAERPASGHVRDVGYTRPGYYPMAEFVRQRHQPGRVDRRNLDAPVVSGPAGSHSLSKQGRQFVLDAPGPARAGRLLGNQRELAAKLLQGHVAAGG